MADVEIRVTANTELAILQLRQWYEEAKQVIAQEVKSELEEVLEDIKANYVPIDKGDLRDSGQVDPVEIDSRGNLVTGISFGDEKVPYARIQHEDLTFQHPHGQAKYIEVPLRRWVDSKK